MPSIYDLLQNMNPGLNQKQMSLKDLIAQDEQKKRDDLIAQQTQKQIQTPISQEQLQQNIPIQDIAMPNTELPQQDNNPNAGLMPSFETFYGNKPVIPQEQLQYKKPVKPYSITDFGKFTKQGKGFWGKTGGAIADILSAFGTPEGMKIGALLSHGLGADITTAKAMVDQGDITAAQQSQKQAQYDKNLKDLMDIAKEYDIKGMEYLGKQANKEKTQLIYDPRVGEHGAYYLPETDENGEVKFRQIDPNDYPNRNISIKQLNPDQLIAMNKSRYIQSMQPGTAGYANLATKLSDDYRQDIKDYTTLVQKYRTMETLLEESLKNPKKSMAAVDQAIVTAFNKMIDETSVVRESEYARTPEGQSLLNQVEGYIDKIKKGGVGLAPDERFNLVNAGAKLMEVANENYKNKRDSYYDMANEYGIKPSLVLGKDLVYKPKIYNLEKYNNKNIPSFSSESEANSANLKKGTIILINGKKAVVE